MSNVTPASLELQVLDINPDTRVNPLLANSTLDIYNAYVKGLNSFALQNPPCPSIIRVPDVVINADNVIANSYYAARSPVYTLEFGRGFNAAKKRSYTDNPLDPNTTTLYAEGFNTVGQGLPLVFDIRGINPDLVSSAIYDDVNQSTWSRNYYIQSGITTIQNFTNKFHLPETDYKANNVMLSVDDNAMYNRGAIFNYLYANYAYIDTKDVNLVFNDAIINDYAEFRNGNGWSDACYRWLAIVDNDFRRLISNDYQMNIPVTLQLYTRQTGSFNLDMGYLIVLGSVAPAVYYNPYEVMNIPETENSFYRLTFKDDEIQEHTTTPGFKDINKATYKPIFRKSLRFKVENNNISGKLIQINSNSTIKNILDISSGGLAIEYNGTLKVGDQFTINLTYKNVAIIQEVKVVRINGNIAGLKFINLDEATANKILYINMLLSQEREKTNKLSLSK